MDRARAIRIGALSNEYTARFCAPDAVDGLFLAHFLLTKDQILKAAELNDSDVAVWFKGLATATDERIGDWNHIASNLGRPGFPMAEQLPAALRGKYKHVADRSPQTIFEMLNADEVSPRSA
jgi:hypothetical protein